MEINITKISHSENLHPEGNVKSKDQSFSRIDTLIPHFDYLILLILF